MAKILKQTGVNFNYAPCVDLAINPDSIIVKKQMNYIIINIFISLWYELHYKRQ